MTHSPTDRNKAMTDPLFLHRINGERVAYLKTEGGGPGILWLGGFHSDMNGTKAQAVAAWAARTGRASLRFDYFGHGRSSGNFRNGTISAWRNDALAVLDTVAKGPQILVASSMGGWIAMLLAHQRPKRIAGMLLIAPAPDFTEDLMWAKMPPEIRRQIMEEGSWLRPSEYEEPYPITRELIEDGRHNLVLDRPLDLPVPVRILHGMADRDVPWEQGFKLMDVLTQDTTFTAVKGADHRMSSPANLKLIEQALERLIEDVEQ
jgi:pimeloyl-ACP methyl ester carboxylesterase